jgi:hypothetical protein
MRVDYLIAITVVENKMRLVKRMFAELALNAARNDKSAHQRVRQNENVEASSTRRRDFYRPHHRNMAGVPWHQPTMPASRSLRISSVLRPSSDRRTASLSSPREEILLRANARPFENRGQNRVAQKSNQLSQAPKNVQRILC